MENTVWGPKAWNTFRKSIADSENAHALSHTKATGIQVGWFSDTSEDIIQWNWPEGPGADIIINIHVLLWWYKHEIILIFQNC